MRIPNFLLCCVILVLGTIAFRNFTNANPDPIKQVNSDVDLSFNLSDSDLDKIDGIVNEKLDPIREDLQAVESSLSNRIDGLQTKLTDCCARCDAVKVHPVAPVAKPVAQPVVQSASVRSSHWSYPGDITTHLGNDHNKITSGMSTAQQLAAHDAIHESERGGLFRSVTRTNVQSVPIVPIVRYAPATSNCPGGVCPTSASSVTRSSSFSMPRLFRRR